MNQLPITASHQVGSVFNDRYDLLEKIGEGGWASVYRARDRDTSELVALKILSTAFLVRKPKEAERNVRRFRREAQILKLLRDCPHVVRIKEEGQTANGEEFIVMELLEGDQLRQHMGRGRAVMEAPVLVRLGIELTRGLLEIHAKGILHRDLAPDNVIIVKTEDGEAFPKYVDFGIGKSLDGDLDEVTEMLTIMGKPEYFSPEQARGEELTVASDVYPLGVILYEMVTGYVPIFIRGGVRGTRDLIRLQTMAPTPFENFPEAARIPPEFRDVVLRCLHKNPEARPPVRDILDVLEASKTRIDANEDFALETPTLVVRRDTTEQEISEAARESKTVEFRRGDVFKDRYRINSLVGRGGMGAVYHAWDKVLSRETALKIHTEVHDHLARRAILHEAKASASLDRCPNIVTIYDAGFHEGVPYIAMEFVEGRTLREAIDAGGTITGPRFLNLAVGLCEGLRTAHEQTRTVIHRDLKPSNVILTDKGVPKITDFGIAKVVHRSGSGEEDDHTLVGIESSGAGTAATMSPEQANNDPVDERSDIYSLGCILYWMVTGRPPFVGDPLAVLVQHGTRTPDAPSKLNRQMKPRALDRIILRCLEKDPQKRYQRVSDLASGLQGLQRPEAAVAAWYRSPLSLAASILILCLAAFLVPWSPPEVLHPETAEDSILDVSGMPYERDRVYYVSHARVPLYFGPDQQDILVTCTQTGGDWREEVPRDSNRLFLTLPSTAGHGERFEVRGLSSGLTRFRFHIQIDRLAPLISVRSPGQPWTPLGHEITVLETKGLEFRFRDDGAGFGPGRDGEPQADVTLAPGETGPFGRCRVYPIKGDEIVIVAFDRLNHGRKERPRKIRRVPPTVRLRTDRSRIVTRGTGTLDITLEADGFELADVSLPGALHLELEGLANGLPFHWSAADRCYRADLKLIASEAEAATVRSATVTYEGIPLPFAGERRLVVVHDTEKPQITLLHEPAGLEAARYTPDNPPPGPLKTRPGAALGNALTIIVSDDGGGLGDKPKLTVQWASGPIQVDIPGDGRVSLPDPKDATDADKAVTVVARDAAGNEQSLQFQIAPHARQILTSQVDGAPRKAGPEGQAFYVARGGSIQVVASGSGVRGELWLHLLDERRRPLPGRLHWRMERTGSGFWRAENVELPTGKNFARLHLAYYESAEARGEPFRVDSLVLDKRGPTVSVRYPEFVDGRLPAHGASRLPVVEITAADPGGVAVPGDSVLSRDDALLYEVRTQGSGAEIVVRLVPRGDGIEFSGSRSIALTLVDHAGNPAVRANVPIHVESPEFHVTRVQGAQSERFRFRDQPVPVGPGGLRLDLRPEGPTASYLVCANVTRSEAEESTHLLLDPLESAGIECSYVIPLDHLPAPGGQIVFRWRDPTWSDPERWSESAVDIIEYRVDDEAPRCWLLIDGQRQDARGVVDIGNLTQVFLVVFDAGGLPGSPLQTAVENLGPPVVSPEGREARYPVVAADTWKTLELRSRMVDRVGNGMDLSVGLRHVESYPSLFPLHDATGVPLETTADGWALSRTTHVVRAFEVTENQRVKSFGVRIYEEDGKHVMDLNWTPSKTRNGEVGIALTRAGRYRLAFFANGDLANPFREECVLVDTQPPRLEAESAGNPVAPGRPLDPAGVELRVSDLGGSGVARLEFRLSDGTDLWQDVLDGAHGGETRRPLPAALLAALPRTGATAEVTAYDRLGRSTLVKLVLAPPSFPELDLENVSSASGAALGRDEAGRLLARETGLRVPCQTSAPGASSVAWDVNGSAWPDHELERSRQELPLDLPGDGVHTIRLRPRVGGSVAPPVELIVLVDQTEPSFRVSPEPNGNEVVVDRLSDLTIVAEDATSGLVAVEWKLNGGSPDGGEPDGRGASGNLDGSPSWPLPPLPPAGGGRTTHQLTLTARDRLGNEGRLQLAISLRYHSPFESQDDRARVHGLTWALLPTGHPEDPGNAARYEISQHEITCGQVRSFWEATKDDASWWAQLQPLLRRLGSARHVSSEDLQDGCQRLMALVSDVVERNRDMPDAHPVRFVSPQAAAVCSAWFGARLPTAAEWRAAARGSFLVTATPDHPVWPVLKQGALDKDNVSGLGLHVACEAPGPLPVLELGPDVTPGGVAGMAGNVREIVSAVDSFLVAGGSWRTAQDHVPTLEVATPGEDVGFRVLRVRRRK